MLGMWVFRWVWMVGTGLFTRFRGFGSSGKAFKKGILHEGFRWSRMLRTTVTMRDCLSV